MSRIVLAGLVTIVLGFAFFGCSGESAGRGPGGEGLPVADSFESDVPAFWGGQKECPVCKGTPIRAQHHVDVDAGRIYFDNAECVKEFKNNKEKYLAKLNEKLKKMMEPSYVPGE